MSGRRLDSKHPLCSAGVFAKDPVKGRPRRDLTAGLTGVRTGRQIDRFIYELHGLTYEEIRIVEGGERMALNRYPLSLGCRGSLRR